MEAIEPRFPLTVIVLTRDEEVNITDCLRTVAWADDVIVVDSGSTDGTLDLARSVRPDVHIFSRPFTDFGDQRNWAIDNTAPRHEWILFLDADERCDAACAAAIRGAVLKPGDHKGFFLCYRNMFLGRWLKHSAMFPSWQLRLFQVGYVRFAKEGHGQREVSDHPLGYLRQPYDHYGFSKGIELWVNRQNIYSNNEIELVDRLASEPLVLSDLLRGAIPRRRGLKRIVARYPSLRLLIFHYLFFVRRGFLDGYPGFIHSLLRLSKEIQFVAKIHEHRFRK